jgi:hypothetical protein
MDYSQMRVKDQERVPSDEEPENSYDPAADAGDIAQGREESNVVRDDITTERACFMQERRKHEY